MTVIEYLRSKAASLPEEPGVYIMKNAEGNIIYVGKSKKLKNRVGSYFSQNHTSLKTARLVSQIRDFDYILCKTEMEALTLENVLIKKHLPKYNIRLKDAKSYPYIKITSEPFPRLSVTRERSHDGAKYFGPYQSAAAAYSALEVVKKIFSLPTCKRVFPADIGKERPCIYRDMGRCIAPCTGNVTEEEYSALIKCAERVLGGVIRDTVNTLSRDMQRAADNLEFEWALMLRDRIAALKALRQKQHVVSDEKIMRDAFSLYTSDTEAVLASLSVREGAVVAKNEFILSLAELTSPEDAVYLIADYYEGASYIPREVLIDFDISDEDISLLSQYLSLIAGRHITVKGAVRGEGRALLELARRNAEEAARQYRLEGEREDKNVRRLAALLALPTVPARIEAYDISNIGDECITASMVVWYRGKIKKSDYRKFRIRLEGGRDDYASMREAITRRLAHIGTEDSSLGKMPDLILLDGGDTHVGAIRPIIEKSGLNIPVFGMVKDDFHKTRALTDGENEIAIAQELNVYAFIYKLQEEAHRFAYQSSQSAKTKTLTRSSLEKIPGIGPAKAKLLLKSMTLSEIKAAEVQALAQIRGISSADAERIYSYFHKENP